MSDLSLDQFPPRDPKIQGVRRVYFDVLDPTNKGLLEQRGYAPILLFELPRDDDDQHKEYLYALAQGMSEGTIPADRQRIAACELEMRARKMLTAKEVKRSKKEGVLETEKLLDAFGGSRHAHKETTRAAVEASLGLVDEAEKAPEKPKKVYDKGAYLRRAKR